MEEEGQKGTKQEKRVGEVMKIGERSKGEVNRMGIVAGG